MIASRPYIRVPYKEVDWVFVSNHYDIHLTGLARHNGELMRFHTPQFYWYTRRPNPIMVRLYRMTLLEKAQALLNKWAFEVCVGKHWTYPHRRLGVGFRRRPFLYSLYYLVRRT